MGGQMRGEDCCNGDYFSNGYVFRDVVAFLRTVAKILCLAGACLLIQETHYYREALETSDGVFDKGHMGYLLIAIGFIIFTAASGLSLVLGLFAYMFDSSDTDRREKFWPEYHWKYLGLEFVDFVCHLFASIYVMQVVRRYSIDTSMTDGMDCDGTDKDKCAVIRTSQYQVLYGHDLLMRDAIAKSMSVNPLEDRKSDVMYLDHSTMVLAWIFFVRFVVSLIGLLLIRAKPWIILPLRLFNCHWGCNDQFYEGINVFSSFRNHDWVSCFFYFVGFIVISTGLQHEHTGSYIVSNSVIDADLHASPDSPRCIYERAWSRDAYTLYTILADTNGVTASTIHNSPTTITTNTGYLNHFHVAGDVAMGATQFSHMRMNQMSCYNMPLASSPLPASNTSSPNLAGTVVHTTQCCPNADHSIDFNKDIGSSFYVGQILLLVASILGLISELAFSIATWSYGKPVRFDSEHNYFPTI